MFSTVYIRVLTKQKTEYRCEDRRNVGEFRGDIDATLDRYNDSLFQKTPNVTLELTYLLAWRCI
jgi:hypothetical protein